MSFLKSRQISTPPTGMSAGQWMEARKNERSNESSKSSTKKYAFLDDTSSEESFSEPIFLKKSAQSEGSFKKQKIKPSDVPDRPKTSRGQAGQRSISGTSSRGSSAVNRFSQLEKDIMSRQSKPIPSVFSSSDMDLDISSDSEIKREMFAIKNKDKSIALAPKEADISSRTKESTDNQFLHSNLKSDTTLPEKRSKFATKKAVSFASNLVETLYSESDVSLDHFLPEQYSDETSLDEVLSEPNIIMSLDDLHPAEEVHHKPEIMKLHSVDELLSSTDYEDSRDSKEFRSDSVDTVESESDLFNVQSIEELVHVKPPTTTIFKPNDVASTKEKDKANLTVPKANPDDDEYSDDFDSTDVDEDTLKDTESIAEDITEEIKTESAKSITESVESEIQERVSYSDSFDTLTSDELTSSTTSSSAQESKHLESAAVQTDPVEISNRLMEEKLVPNFTESEKTFYKPSQVINNEALAVLSSYSPAVLAVQEMLKQQLAFTRDFIARSERLHQAAADTLVADYQYASLEEARQVINMERQRMNLPPKYPTTS